MIKCLGGLALAAGLLASGSAGATTYDLGSLYEQGVTQFGLYGVNGTFSDTLDFSISAPFNAVKFGIGTLDVQSIEIWSTYPYYGIYANSLNMTLYNSNNVEITSGTDFEMPDLHKGDYYVVISGTTFGVAGGEYGGIISVESIPEAGTGVMMLAGLGMLGYAALRRRAGQQ